MPGLIDASILKPELANSFITGWQEAEDRRNKLTQQAAQNRLAELQYSGQQQENQLRGLQLSDAQQAAQNKLLKRQAYEGATDLGEVQKRLQQAGLSDEAFALQEQIKKQQAEKVKQAKDTLELVQHYGTRIAVNPDPMFARNQVIELGQVTGQDMTSVLAELDNLGGNPEAIRQWGLAHSKNAGDALKQHFVSQNLGGSERVLAIPELGGPATVVPGSSATITPSPNAPRTTVTNIMPKVETEYGKKFASSIADRDLGMFDAASKAPEVMANANRIEKIIRSGKVITGTGANVRLQLAKALQLAGGTDSERIANTEVLIASLAQNTLNAIKTSGLGAGQGFTNTDREFLEKAVGGTVTLDGKSILRLTDLSRRAAAANVQKWNKRVKTIPASALEGTGVSAEPISIGGSGGNGGGPRVGAVEGGYRFKGGNPGDPASWEKVK